MTTVFNLNRYDKIVANDLSLNGTISTALGGLSQWEDSGSDIYFSSGNVGIGTSSPTRKLHIHDSGTCYLQLTSDSITNGLHLATITSGDAFIIQNEARPLRINVNGSEAMRITSDHYIGIGTNSPSAPLHVEGSASTGVEGNKGAYFRWADNNGGHLTYNTSNTTMNVGIRSYQSIATNAYIISFSDMRLKKDIIELTDDSSLQKIRLLKPSSYKYKDPITKNEFNTVDGFIAQEVKEIMPHATGIITDIIPNIMILGTSIIDGSNTVSYTHLTLPTICSV